MPVESIKASGGGCEGGGVQRVEPNPGGGIFSPWHCIELLEHGDDKQEAGGQSVSSLLLSETLALQAA